MRTHRRWLVALTVAASLALTATALESTLSAQAKPANATAECKDGTYSTAASKRGACSGHGGIKVWFADDAKANAKSAKENAKAAGKATGAAAKDVGEATKDAAKSAAKGTEKGAKAAGKATKDAAVATKDAVTGRPSTAPADATGRCKDGSYTHAKQHRGACSGHGGVAEWY